MRGVHARASVEPRLQSRAWLFACVARFARRTKRKERLLVVYFQCIWLLCNSRGIGLKSINIRKCYLQHNRNVFANNANFTVKAWFFEESNYVPVNSKTALVLPYPVRGIRLFEKFWSDSPVCGQFRWSNVPPASASKSVKSPTH